jgi:hypothetical protein
MKNCSWIALKGGGSIPIVISSLFIYMAEKIDLSDCLFGLTSRIQWQVYVRYFCFEMQQQLQFDLFYLASCLFVEVGRDNMSGLQWAYCRSVYDRSLWIIGVMIICKGEPSEIWSSMCFKITVTSQAIIIFENRSTRRRICPDVTVPTGTTLIIKPRLSSEKEPSFVCSGWCFRVVVKD